MCDTILFTHEWAAVMANCVYDIHARTFPQADFDAISISPLLAILFKNSRTPLGSMYCTASARLSIIIPFSTFSQCHIRRQGLSQSLPFVPCLPSGFDPSIQDPGSPGRPSRLCEHGYLHSRWLLTHLGQRRPHDQDLGLEQRSASTELPFGASQQCVPGSGHASLRE